MREPRPSDRVRVRDDLEVSPGSLDVLRVGISDRFCPGRRASRPSRKRCHRSGGFTYKLVYSPS